LCTPKRLNPARKQTRRFLCKLASDTKKSILNQPGLKMSRYLVIIEQTSTGLSAYSPDLPGCVVTGATREEVEKEMHDAIEFHLEGLRLEGKPIPVPRSEATYCEV
jgi:predicted RNase H-like HicB family nuclease